MAKKARPKKKAGKPCAGSKAFLEARVEELEGDLVKERTALRALRVAAAAAAGKMDLIRASVEKLGKERDALREHVKQEFRARRSLAKTARSQKDIIEKLRRELRGKA